MYSFPPCFRCSSDVAVGFRLSNASLLGGQIQIHAEGSALLEGHVFVLNSIHSFLLNRILKKQLLQKSSESFDLRSGSLVARVMTGKLIEQDVESIM